MAEKQLIHKVGDGEHLSAIAAKYGFSSFDQLWNDEVNKKLRSYRDDPHQLLPGDEVVIPPTRPRTFKRVTGQTHEFAVFRDKLKISLCVYDLFGEAIANEMGTLSIDGTESPVTTDADGNLKASIPRTASAGLLKLGEHEFSLRIGALPPPEKLVGIRARLNNMGFWAGEAEYESRDDTDLVTLTSAIEEFQAANDMTPDGIVSAELIAKLVEVHGC